MAEGLGKKSRMVDPVCGRRLDANAQKQPLRSHYKQQPYFFCSESCRHAFQLRIEHFKLHELAAGGGLMRAGGVIWGQA